MYMSNTNSLRYSISGVFIIAYKEDTTILEKLYRNKILIMKSLGKNINQNIKIILLVI
jgi:hypothetical protein